MHYTDKSVLLNRKFYKSRRHLKYTEIMTYNFQFGKYDLGVAHKLRDGSVMQGGRSLMKCDRLAF